MTTGTVPRTVELARAAADYITRRLLPEEAVLSLPIPVLRDQTLVAVCFAAIAVPRDDDTNDDVYAPTVQITLDWRGGAVLEHAFIGAAVPVEDDQPIGRLRPPQFEGPLTEALEQQLNDRYWRLYELLDVVAALYPRRSLPAADGAAVQEFRTEFSALLCEELLPHYVALNPAFFNWLQALSEMQTARACPQCGAPRLGTASFCSNCGATVRAA